MIDSKKQVFIIVGVFTLILALTTVTYAFFNYTKTGGVNNLGTGRISFNTTEGTTLNLTNVFPMTSTEAGNANLDSVTVGIVGDTNFTDGEEYEISLVNVTNTINNKEIPINYIATYTPTSGNTIGSSSNNYFNVRENKNASIYILNSEGEVTEGKQVLAGYIKSGSTGINGTLTIKAYIDADRIAISDTYNGPEATPSDNMGTTGEWIDNRVVLTTTEWNSLSTTPISFKIKAESNEGIWIGRIKSCPDCKFLYTNNMYYTTWNMAGYDSTNQVDIPVTPSVVTTGLYDNYLELISITGKDYFLGVKLNSSNQITNDYACGIKNDVPFCVEGALWSGYGGTTDEEIYNKNVSLVQGPSLYNNTCTTQDATLADGANYLNTTCGPLNNTTISVGVYSHGGSIVGMQEYHHLCVASNYGHLTCVE